MRFGVNLPNFADFADPDTAIALAVEAESYGWDGFFIWDHINVFRDFALPMADPWILLAAAARETKSIRLGPMVTPLPRRRPWKVARETATLDCLSHGRLILGVGLGLPPETEYGAFGEPMDLKTRAEMLDEGLEILTGLWSAQPFEFAGKHYTVEKTIFAPPPVQQPRIPIWVAGSWPRRGPLLRAARWDGFFPLKLNEAGESVPVEPEDLALISEELLHLRGDSTAYDFVVGDEVTSLEPTDRSRLRAYDDAGATWWCEGLSTRQLDIQAMFERIRQGPPAI